MFDIEDFLWRHFHDVVPYRTTDLRVDCPFCGERYGADDVSKHLHVSLEMQTCHCFRCDYASSWVGLVMDVTGFDYHHALGELYTPPNPKEFDSIHKDLLSRPQEPDELPQVRGITLPEDFIGLWEDFQDPVIDRIRQYMSGRGFGGDVWEKYSLGYVPSVGPRLYIPVEGDYWQARAVYKFQEPRYIGADSSTVSLLSHSVALQKYDEVVITEGVLSGIAVGDNHVSLVGKNPTPQKVDRLVRAPVTHYIVTVEATAVTEMLSLARELRGHGKRVTLWKYDDGDPADSSPTAKEYMDFSAELRLLLS